MRTLLKPYEKVVLIVRVHWLPTLLRPMVLAILLFALGIWLGHYALVLSGLAVVYSVRMIMEWRCNLWIVTDRRVVVESGWLRHYAKECLLTKINNVSYAQSLWGRLLGYGDVAIQTAGAFGVTHCQCVRNPERLKDAITSLLVPGAWAATSFTFAGKADLVQVVQGTTFMSVSTELEKLCELRKRGVLCEEEYMRLKGKLIESSLSSAE